MGECKRYNTRASGALISRAVGPASSIPSAQFMMKAKGVTGCASIDRQDPRRWNPLTAAGLSFTQIKLGRATSEVVCSPTPRHSHSITGRVILVGSSPIAPSITLPYILDMGVHKIIAKSPRKHLL